MAIRWNYELDKLVKVAMEENPKISKMLAIKLVHFSVITGVSVEQTKILRKIVQPIDKWQEKRLSELKEEK